MINEGFVIVGALISFVGGLSYLIDTVSGKTKPNRVTWLLWSLAPGIALAGQLTQGVRAAALLTFIVAFNPALIFIASFFNKKSYWKLTGFDYVCGALSVLAIILWQVTKVGNVAIGLSILADFFAGVPTIVKAYRFPKTENYKVFLGGAVAAIITLLTITTWNFENYGFAVYILAINILLVFLIMSEKFRFGVQAVEK